MEPPFDDVATRVIALSGTALRLIASMKGKHYTTLRDATFKNRKQLPSGLVKQLSDLNTAATILRHYTDPWAADFVSRLEDGLKCIESDEASAKDVGSDGLGFEVLHMVEEEIVHIQEEIVRDQNAVEQGCDIQQQDVHVPEVQAFYMGDEVSVGVQTMHDFQNTQLCTGIEQVLDEITRAALLKLLSEVAIARDCIATGFMGCEAGEAVRPARLARPARRTRQARPLSYTIKRARWSSGRLLAQHILASLCSILLFGNLGRPLLKVMGGTMARLSPSPCHCFMMIA